MATQRRELIRGGLALGALSVAAPALAAGELLPRRGRRVVVVGGGWGGITAAKYIRLMDPAIEVVLIEPKTEFRSCPTSNWVIGGLWKMSQITRSYDTLAKRHGVAIVNDRVTAIDPAAKSVRVDGGSIGYDRLLLSPGVELVYDGIDGMDARARERMPAAWSAGPETLLLRRQLEALPARGTVVMTVPLSPYRCPPGPYERASLIADYLKRQRPGARLIVLDANAKIISKGTLFARAWDDLYADIIDYRTDQQLVGVDAGNMTVRTAFDTIKADVVNLIPPQRAHGLCLAAGLVLEGRNWTPVDAMTFEAAAAPGIHVVGDATDQTTVGKVPKSGFVANSMAKVAAAAMEALMNDRPPPRPSMANTCYSLVSAEEGISVTALYRWDEASRRFVVPPGASGLSPARSPLIAAYAADWAHAIWDDMLT